MSFQMELVHNYKNIDDVNIHYVESSPLKIESGENSTIVFLHGFPESWHTWNEQLSYFAANHHVVAPDLPGYNLSDKPTSLEFYQVANLIQFVTKFITSVKRTDKIILVAHDWGGAIAWPLTAFSNDLVEKLVILNAAHPTTFTREMINNDEQRKKSDYIHSLITNEAEDLLSRNDYQYLQEKVLCSAKEGTFNPTVLKRYKEAWSQPNAVTGMLNYYRAMPQLAPPSQSTNSSSSGPVTNLENMHIPKITIGVPTLVLWGELDQAFSCEVLNGLNEYVPDLTIRRFRHASHWLQHEEPNAVNQCINEFIN